MYIILSIGLAYIFNVKLHYILIYIYVYNIEHRFFFSYNKLNNYFMVYNNKKG